MSEPSSVQSAQLFPDGGVVLVTGGGSGIGRATSIVAGLCGLSVIVWDIRMDAAEEVVESLRRQGTKALGVEADITNPDSVDEAMRRSDTFGAPRYLVNNAGPLRHADVTFNDGISQAVGSVADVTGKWLNAFAEPGASVVNVASTAGNDLGDSPAWYSAAKAAIAGLTRSLAVASAPGVRVNAVSPFATATPRIARFAESEAGRHAIRRLPLQRIADPAEIAWPIVFLLSPRASYIDGQVIRIDGGRMVAP